MDLVRTKDCIMNTDNRFNKCFKNKIGGFYITDGETSDGTCYYNIYYLDFKTSIGTRIWHKSRFDIIRKNITIDDVMNDDKLQDILMAYNI